jgi:hypothetical protein
VDDEPAGTPQDFCTITLTVIDDEGGEGAAFASALIRNAAPVVSALGLSAAEIMEGGMVWLSGLIVDAGLLDTHAVSIDWGDGAACLADLDPATRIFAAVRTYPGDGDPGTPYEDYTITVTVTDDDTSVGMGSVVLRVVGAPPVDSETASSDGQEGCGQSGEDATDADEDDDLAADEGDDWPSGGMEDEVRVLLSNLRFLLRWRNPGDELSGMFFPRHRHDGKGNEGLDRPYGGEARYRLVRRFDELCGRHGSKSPMALRRLAARGRIAQCSPTKVLIIAAALIQ